MAIVFGSPEADAILKDQKERAKKEREKAEQEKYKWVSCDRCKGKGTCPTCKARRGVVGCIECNDSGDCPWCDGDGEVQMVKTKEGWAYVSG